MRNHRCSSATSATSRVRAIAMGAAYTCGAASGKIPVEARGCGRLGAWIDYISGMSSTIETLFGVRRALIGVLHVLPLPGTASSSHSVAQIVERAVAEARKYEEAGFNGLILENMHDRPYLKGSV